jgi:hypothetical protein
VRDDAGSPDDGPGRDRLPGGQSGAVRLHRVQGGSQTHLDAAAAQLGDRVVREAGVDLGKDPVTGLDQDPAHAVQARAGVAVHRVGGEVLQLGKGLQPRVATADEDVGQQPLAMRGILGGVGQLQSLDHVVPQPDRVGEALEPDRVPVQPWNGKRARD